MPDPRTYEDRSLNALEKSSQCLNRPKHNWELPDIQAAYQAAYRRKDYLTQEQMEADSDCAAAANRDTRAVIGGRPAANPKNTWTRTFFAGRARTPVHNVHSADRPRATLKRWK